MDEFQKEQFEAFGHRAEELRRLAVKAQDSGDFATALGALKEAYQWDGERVRIRIQAALKKENR